MTQTLCQKMLDSPKKKISLLHFPECDSLEKKSDDLFWKNISLLPQLIVLENLIS